MSAGMSDKIVAAARRVLAAESAAVGTLEGRIGAEFLRAVEMLLALKGQVIASGVGKSGLVARKVASTLTSTGTPALYLHPVEALHGDVGIVRDGDVAMLFSNSGVTEEVCLLLPLFRRIEVGVIALTGAPDSALGRKSDVVLDCSVHEEACPHNLAPTSSALAAMAMGDALAMALLEARGFTEEDFAQLHPGGRLGRRLLTRVDELMHGGDEVPWVTPDQSMRSVLVTMTSKRLGCAVVVNGDKSLQGIFTDGDLRRLTQAREDFLGAAVGEVMGRSPKTIEGHVLATAALAKMEEYSITQLVVVDSEGMPVGVLHLHDLLKAGIV